MSLDHGHLKTERQLDHLRLLNSLPHAFALHEILLDDKGTPSDYRFIMVNPAFEKITGLSASKIIGKTVREILPHIEQRWIDFYSRVAITGRALEFEEFNSDLGKHFHVYAYCPQPGQFAAIFYDILQEVEHETSLAYGARWFDQLFEAAPLMMLGVDERGKIRCANRSFLQCTGWERSYLLEKHISAIIHALGDHHENGHDEIAFWAMPEALHLPCKLKRRDGTSARFQLDCRRTYGPHGGMLTLCVFQNLDSSSALSGILEESEERFRSAFEHSGIGMALVSPDGRFLQVNRALCNIVGHSTEELLTRNFQQITYEADLDKDVENVRRMLRNEIDTYTMEKRYIHKSGRLVWIQLIVTAVHDENHKVKYFVSQIQDITNRKDFEDEMVNAKEAAEAGSRAKSAFLAQMSHEIRTPMNSIIAPANMLLEMPMDDSRRELVEMIQKSSEHLMGVINDILDYSKIEANKVELENLPFHLGELIQDIIDQASLFARSKSLALDAQIEQGTPAIWKGDPVRIRQILLNLVNNAIKFTDEGTIRIHAGERPSPDNHGRKSLRLAVEDTGIGISPEQRQRLFEAFEQGDASIHRRYGGTGLGLVICQKLVQLMGGTINLMSALGQGTKVEILLPCTVAEDFNLPITRNTAPPTRLPNLSNRKILVVDDNTSNRLIAVKMLRRLGCEPSVATNGQEAVDLATQLEFDLILMDCEMPVMNGFQATRKIRELEKSVGNRTPIVALTAHASMATNQECFSSGMDDYLSKPANLALLAQMLERWLVRISDAQRRQHDPGTTDRRS